MDWVQILEIKLNQGVMLTNSSDHVQHSFKQTLVCTHAHLMLLLVLKITVAAL